MNLLESFFADMNKLRFHGKMIVSNSVILQTCVGKLITEHLLLCFSHFENIRHHGDSGMIKQDFIKSNITNTATKVTKNSTMISE